MVNIVHFGKYYAPETGGIESVTSVLARGSVEAGHNVTVICFAKLYNKDREIIDRVNVIRAPLTAILASQPIGWKYLWICLKHGRKADVIHMHAPNMLAALCCMLVGKRPRLLVHWHSDVVNKGLLGQIFKPLETVLLKRADRIIATSQNYLDASSTLAPFKDKVKVVPIGIPDITQPNTLDNLSQDLLVKLKGKRLVLSVGRLVPYKGFEILIKAVKDLHNDAFVVIVGGGPLHEKLNAAIEAAGVGNRVHLAGRLSDNALRILFGLAEIYCLPSIERSEAFGVVLLEAMANGLPIVATEISGSGVPWVNQDGMTGINVPVADPIALAAACNRILNCEGEQRRLSDGARQRFVKEFKADISIRRVMAIYAQFFTAHECFTK